MAFLDTQCLSRGGTQILREKMKSLYGKKVASELVSFYSESRTKESGQSRSIRLDWENHVASEQQSPAIQARVSLIIALEDRELKAKCKEGLQWLPISFVCATISRGIET